MIDLIPKLIQAGIEEVPEEFGGPGYRCAVWLKDGTYLPCVFVQKIGPIADRLRDLVNDEFQRNGQYDARTCDPVREFLKSRLSTGIQIPAYEIERVEPSRFAIPISLLAQVTGETAMSLWVFFLETADRRRFEFSGAHLCSMLFFGLPDGVEFTDFNAVRNFKRGQRLPKCEASFRERAFFDCYVDDEPPYSADLSALGLE